MIDFDIEKTKLIQTLQAMIDELNTYKDPADVPADSFLRNGIGMYHRLHVDALRTIVAHAAKSGQVPVCTPDEVRTQKRRDDVWERVVGNGETMASLARAYKVSPTTISTDIHTHLRQRMLVARGNPGQLFIRRDFKNGQRIFLVSVYGGVGERWWKPIDKSEPVETLRAAYLLLKAEQEKV